MPSSVLLVDDNPVVLSALSEDLCWRVPSLHVDTEPSSLKAREVPLTETLRNCLAELRERDGVSRIQGLVFERDRQKLTHTYRKVQQICKEQRIENFRFHDLRHCAVTNLAEIGIETETIMRIVGHSSVEMFLRYRSVRPEHLDAAMKRLDSALGTVMAPPSSAVR